MAELPSCQECGACCTTFLEFGRGGFVRVSDADQQRLPEKYRLKVVMESDPGVDRLGTRGTPSVGYRCVALKGTPGRHTRCDIYEDRPSLCRTLERGSPDCLKERALWAHGKRAEEAQFL